jgi:uncharacterized protein (TIGR04222 family)
MMNAFKRLVVLVGIAVLALLAAPFAYAQDSAFPALDPQRHVYDETTTSLTPQQVDDLERRLSALPGGADAIVYVRALDTDPDDTLDQAEELQQAWVARTGTNQDTAVAILINRNPDDPNDARAGIFVGRTFDDGNVPEGEQRDIVDDALIPPLRDGDVYGSLVAGLDRLSGSIRNGPPQSAFDRWSVDAANGWLPWTALGVAAVAAAAALALHSRRQRAGLPVMEPTTRRPGELSPAVAGALVFGAPQATLVPAVLLDLAEREALAIEQEDGDKKVGVRLLDPTGPRDDVERAVWTWLDEHAENGRVAAKHLNGQPGPALAAAKERMRTEGWIDPGSTGRRVWMSVIAVLAGLAFIFAIIVAAAADAGWAAWLGAAALAGAAVLAATLAIMHPPLSAAGQKAAAPWHAYRDGLKKSAKEGTRLDLDTALPYAVAFGLGSAMGKQLEQAPALRAYGGAHDPAMMSAWWVAFTSSTTSSSSSSTVSGAGAGGGGGAAGST